MNDLVCPHCGLRNPVGTTLCQRCLMSLFANSGYVDVGSSVEPHVVAAAQASDSGGWRCSGCGAELGPDDPFCSADGEPRASAVPTGASTRPEPAAPKLRLTLPDGSVLSLEGGDRVDLGREVNDRRVTMALANRTGVSRRHARLTLEGDCVTVIDLGSTNGTWVNGAPVDAWVAVPAGELRRIDLGLNAAVHVSVAP